MFVIRTLFEKYVKKEKKPLYICFVDFRKAFDQVWHTGLYYKLLKYNIRGNFFHLIENMYNNSRACIKTKGGLTESFKVTAGVKQGEILSPNLFNLYINDLPSELPVDRDTPYLGIHDVRCLMYADDLFLCSLSPSGLQNSLDNLSSYCEKWHLEINLKKTKVMKLSGNGHKCSRHSFKLNGEPIEIVQKYRYLGVEITSSCSYTSPKLNLANRARKALFKLHSAIADSNLNPSTSLHLFDCLIKPIALYGSEIWGAEDYFKNTCPWEQLFGQKLFRQPADKLNLSFCKSILGVSKKATNLAVLGELGRYPLILDSILNVMKFYQHLEKSDNKLLFNALQESININKGKTFSWYTFVEKMAQASGINPTSFKVADIKKMLKSKYEAHWKKQINQNQSNDTSSGKLSL